MEALELLDHEMPQASRLCASLSKRRAKKDEIAQWLTIVSKLNCQVNLPPTLTGRLQNAIKKTRFTPLYNNAMASLALIKAGKLDEDALDFSTVPLSLKELLDSNGFVRETTRDATGTSYKTAQAMNLLSSISTQLPDLDLSSVVSSMKSSVGPLINSGKKTAGQLIFQSSLTATVTILEALVRFSKTFEVSVPLDVASVNRISKYILSNKYAETVTGSRMVLVGTKYLAENDWHNPVAVFVSNPTIDVTEDDGSRFVLGLQTLDGQAQEADVLVCKSVIQVATGTAVATNLDLSRNAQGLYELNLREVITEPGLYSVAVDVEMGGEEAGVKREVRALGSLGKLKAIMFDHNSRKGATKVSDDHKAKLSYPGQTKKVFSTTGVREIRLEVSSKGAKPEQVHAKFDKAGDCEQDCSFTVPAVAKTKTKKYQWKIDIKKREYAAFTSGMYSVTVIVGGLFIKNPVQWTVGNIDVQIPIVDDDGDEDYEPVDDTTMYFEPRPEIVHTFASPATQANTLVALIFTGLVLAPLVAFITLRDSLLGPISINVSSTGSMFQLSLVASLLACTAYWLAFNLFQVLYMISFIGLFVSFTGYKTMKEVQEHGGFK